MHATEDILPVDGIKLLGGTRATRWEMPGTFIVDEDADSSAIIKESNNEQITDEEDMKSWLEEQNRLVEKRLTERLRDESSTPHED